MNKFFIYPDFKKHRAGLTIIELLTVAGIIAVMVAISIPAIRAMQNSFDSTGTESMINAALSTARTLAISNQQYVGVRFQKEYDVNNPTNTNEDQYMIFIIYEEPKDMNNLTDAFRVIDGYKPVELPENTGAFDPALINNIDSDQKICDASKFSIIFSPAGKLVIHLVQTRNKDGATDGIESTDVVFNTIDKFNVSSSCAQFLQDGSPDTAGDHHEQSNSSLVIYNRQELGKYAPADRYSKYLKDLPVLYINPYTGGIIEK
jgi:competence protein ComGC